MVFEFITGDWRRPTFGSLFNEWWLFVTRRHQVKVPAFCTDWDRKLQNAICNVVNNMPLKKYLEITYKIATGQATVDDLETLLFFCHGHAAGATSRHCNKKPNTKELASSFWRLFNMAKRSFVFQMVCR